MPGIWQWRINSVVVRPNKASTHFESERPVWICTCGEASLFFLDSLAPSKPYSAFSLDVTPWESCVTHIGTFSSSSALASSAGLLGRNITWAPDGEGTLSSLTKGLWLGKELLMSAMLSSARPCDGQWLWVTDDVRRSERIFVVCRTVRVDSHRNFVRVT